MLTLKFKCTYTQKLIDVLLEDNVEDISNETFTVILHEDKNKFFWIKGTLEKKKRKQKSFV